MAEQRDKDRDLTEEEDAGRIGGGPGASDGSSGGGAGSGIEGGGTDMRTEGRFAKGDVEEDRKKLFPEAKTKAGEEGAEREEDGGRGEEDRR